LKLHARRRIGEISLELETAQGERTDVEPLPSVGKKSKNQTLSESGITTSTANRCEKLAKIAESEFESVIADAREKNKPITYADVENGGWKGLFLGENETLEGGEKFHFQFTQQHANSYMRLAKQPKLTRHLVRSDDAEQFNLKAIVAKSERDAKIVELAGQGLSQREIAGEVGVPRETVRNILGGPKRNSSEMAQNEPTNDEEDEFPEINYSDGGVLGEKRNSSEIPHNDPNDEDDDDFTALKYDGESKAYCKYCYTEHYDWTLLDGEAWICGRCEHSTRSV